MRISACWTLYDQFHLMRSDKYVVLTIIGVALAHGIGSVMEVFLICQPLSSQWDANVKGACGNQMVSFLAIEVIGIVLDIAVIVQSIRAFDSMSLSWKEKVGPMLMLNMGAL